MYAIKVVSWMHILWGLSMLMLGEAPRPFGQLEAFLTFIDKYGYRIEWLGVVFVFSGLLAIMSLKYSNKLEDVPHLLPATLMPQQLLLTIGVLFAVGQLLYNGFDIRVWFALCPQVVFTTFHAIGVYFLYKEALLKAKMMEGQNGKRGS